MKLQLEYQVFKPSGKFYTEDFVVLDLEWYERDDGGPAILSYTTKERVVKALCDRYKSMIIYCNPPFGVPFLVTPQDYDEED